MDGEEDNGVMTVEVAEDDLAGTPAAPVEELEVRPEPKPQPKPQPAQRQTSSGADVLRAQLERSTGLVDSLSTANQRAQAELTKARQERANIERTHVETQRSTYEQNVRSIDAGLEEAEQAYAAAFETGDGAKVAKAQRRLSELTAMKVENERQLASLPSQEQLEAHVKASTQPQTREERIEQYIAQFSPRSQQWLRGNPEFIENRHKNGLLLDAHKAAVAKDLVPDTDEYFQYLDEKLGVSQTDGGERRTKTNGQEPAPMKRSSTPVRASAPVRGGSGISVQTMRSVQLTQKEIENATDGTLSWSHDDTSGKGRFKKGDPIGVNEMARRKLAIKQGRTNLRYMAEDQ